VRSVKAQTYKNIEIIVVDDASTDPTATISSVLDPEFENCAIIHLAKNTRKIFGFPCAGHVRNIGAKIASGKYVAFLDDDDVWIPEKLELQIYAIGAAAEMTVGADESLLPPPPPPKMSCTEGYFGHTLWSPEMAATGGRLRLYNREQYMNELCAIYKAANRPEWVNREVGFPALWTREFLDIHNCVITSSTLLERELFENLGGFQPLRNGEEDYDLWKRATKHTNCAYVDTPCFYYYHNAYPNKHV
jgi:glycosyltransferase involved in cell wall biosynthesis